MNYLHRGIIAGIAGASVVMLPMPAASNWGATVVKRSDGQGNTQTVIMSDQYARIETPDPNYYMLMDMGKGKAYQVNAKEKRMVEMDIIGTPPKPPRERRGEPGQDRGERGGPPQDQWERGGPPQDQWRRGGPPQDQWRRGGPPQDRWERSGPPQDRWERGGSPRDRGERSGSRNRGERGGQRGIPQSWKGSVKAELVNKGRGPDIAGYPTVKYQVKANDKVCSAIYFSQKAAEVPYLKAFIKAMFQMSKSRKPKLKGIPLPPCIKAHEQLEAKLMKLGVPMKTVLKGGKRGEMVRDKITSLRTGVDIPDNTFTLPGYETMSEQKAMEERWKQMKKWMEEAKQRRGERPYQQRPRRQERDERRDERPYQRRWREDDERRDERPYQRRWREDDERRDERLYK
ncbi:MAG: hypothetical protein DRR08_20490 [Candidatus Parabeggiatoa sp. nov. 2]|nr:MAG: hypothetical protein B6247_13835 [Beggiatoa sp. 4572_84]RKZ56897.1 MAG: hypothetical protein DRR08_20490 [Gammaproteobacteria bacterium]